jgi:DNA-binding transcriptional LysR family regulator
MEFDWTYEYGSSMEKDELADLGAFLAVAEARSFTRAAAKVGLSQSALSHTIKRLETRLGVRLLTRTTRSVALTDAGERLYGVVRPAIEDISAAVTALSSLRDRPAGTIRISTAQNAADAVLWPAIEKLARRYPDINVELSVNSALVDIVAERFDAGVRLGEQVAKDMIAVRIGPDLRMAAVAAPAYFVSRPKPKTPHDLTGHGCINLRLSTMGGLYAWEFEKDGRPLNVRVGGQLTFNEVRLVCRAAVAGLGIAYLPEDHVQTLIGKGDLVRVLSDWCPPFPGYHLYYPSRRQLSPAFALLVDELRYRRRR